MYELTNEEIKRQDFVDNSIYNMIHSLNPTNKEIEWNIEMIGDVRDEISDWLVSRLELCPEQKFYPFINE